VIPVYREQLYIEKTLRSIAKSIDFASDTLPSPIIILVVNNPQNISQKHRLENQQHIRYLQDAKSMLGMDYTVLDETAPGLQYGVGQARKIGMEYATAKFKLKALDRLVCLDADTTVSLNYVTALYSSEVSSDGFVLCFEHPVHHEPMILYELYLRYLSNGLKLANSPFDFIAIGSAMGCTVRGYQKAGGMPSKSATEDFHFLNKLRKIGPIEMIPHSKVFPSDRLESKTSLGTGTFLKKSKANLSQAFQALMIPAPKDFLRLKHALQGISFFYNKDSLLSIFESIQDLTTFQHLHERGLTEKIFKIKATTTSEKTYQHRLMEVIDGLETMRLLRTYAKHSAKPTKATFLGWAQTLTSDCASLDPKTLLSAYRNL